MAAASSSLVRSEGVPWSKLPREVMECMLSFLPVPTLCRLRTVCKGWNDLLCGPSFHDLHEQRHREVCFLTRFKVTDGYTRIDHPVKGTTCFLDFEERRWYLIKGAKERGFDTRAVGMDEGLVAEFWCEDEEETDEGDTPTVSCVEMSDPISKLKWSLEPPFFECPRDDELPLLVVAADRVSRRFRVFLMDNSGHVAFGHTQFLWIYESSTDKWEYARHPPNLKWEGASNPPRTPETNRITRARSAVFFRGDLYAILSPFASDVCFLMKYDCEKDTWSMIHEDVPEQSAHPQLLVSSDRLFLRFWRSAPSTSNSRRTRNAVLLEIVEIEIPENASKPVFQVPSASLEHFLGESIDDLACVIPRVSSDGSCTSVTLVSGSSGRVIIYNVVSGSADILPAHPLGGAKLKQSNLRRYPRMRYWATHKNLCSRDLLPSRTPSRPPVYVPERAVKWIGMTEENVIEEDDL